MAILRKTIFWLHLTAGVVAGMVILIMSVTGVMLAYEKQIIAWADRDLRVAPTTNSTRLPIESLLAKVRESNPTNTPTAITLRAEPHLSVMVSFGREKTLLVNPYSGEALGEGSKKLRGFMRLMIDWHRWLGREGEGRAVGKAITGACNLAFLFLVISGFYLWFPRQWSAKAFRSVAVFDRGLTGKARDWNWHNVIGFWSALPLALIVGTAVFFSYQWATPVLYRVMGETPPSVPARPETGGPRRGSGERAGEAKFDGLNELVAVAEKEVPGWKTMNIRLGGPAVVFAMDSGNGGQPNRKLQLTLKRGTAEVVSKDTYESYSPARKVRLWSRWIHTGEAFGWVGQTIALLASAGGALLVCTGISLAIRRLAGAMRRAKSPAAQPLSTEARTP
jgi:uncharacterized iron-regulated membrane protein